MGEKKLEKEAINMLTRILGEDECEKLEMFLEEEGIGWLGYPEVLEHCITHKAKNCALFLLKEELPRGKNSALARPNFLSLALENPFCDSEIVEILLRDFCGRCSANLQSPLGFYPIHTLLASLKLVYPLSTWPRDDSLIKLLILLCHPKLKEKLQCVRLLVDYTDQITDIALSFLCNGDVVELAALLLVAHPTILYPLKSASTMMDMGWNDMISRTINGKLPNPAGFGLLYIFEKAGPALSKLYSSIPEDVSGENLIKYITSALRGANIPITVDDVDLAGVLSVEPESMDFVHKYIGVIMDDRIEKRPKPVFPSVRASDCLFFGAPSDNVEKAREKRETTMPYGVTECASLVYSIRISVIKGHGCLGDETNC